ncbi:MAG TPA: IclR family transcriptional regulator [Geopsychrobacteraceae bacterium]|jgi:DNA-binding IclR family transcriptional regulator
MAKDRVEAVERALELLNSFTEDRPVLSLKQLAEQTGFYKSTILRLAASLERFDYLVRQADGIYRLGSTPLRLGEIYRKSFDLGAVVRPVLRELRDRYNESVAFYIKSDASRICLYRANARRAIRHQLEEGRQLPLDRGAGGRVLLAWSGAEGEPYDAIRGRGWCASLGERDPEVAAVAVPVLSADQRLHGALCISGLISRFDKARQEELASALRQTAADLSARLIGRSSC